MLLWHTFYMHRDGSRNSPLAQCAACVGVVCVGKEFAVAFFDIACLLLYMFDLIIDHPVVKHIHRILHRPGRYCLPMMSDVFRRRNMFFVYTLAA